jgi:hypothetical protein
VHVDNYTIIIATKCTSFLLLKAQDITICTFVFAFLAPKNTKTKVQIVISCAFNNKKLVHFVAIIIVLFTRFVTSQLLPG